MTRARVKSERWADSTTPPCPHCGGDMCGSELTLEDIVEAWPLPHWIAVEADGYAHGYQRLVVICGWCAAPSAVAFTRDQIKLVAMRTEKDDRYLSRGEAPAP